MIKKFKYKDEIGVFIVDGKFIDYIGRSKEGFWYWSFILDPEKYNPDTFFDKIFVTSQYAEEGYSVGFFDKLRKLISELELRFEKYTLAEIINYFNNN